MERLSTEFLVWKPFVSIMFSRLGRGIRRKCGEPSKKEKWDALFRRMESMGERRREIVDSRNEVV